MSQLDPISHDDPRWPLFLALVSVIESGQLDPASEAWRVCEAVLELMGYMVVIEKHGVWVPFVGNGDDAAQPLAADDMKEFPL